MTLNLKSKDSWIIFDSYGMALVKSDKLSYGDSVGRTVLCWIAYGMPIGGKMIPSLLFCYSHNCRHPQYPESELSRDHLSYLLIFRRLLFGGYSNLPVYRRGMYLWSLALQNSKLAEFLYYMIYIPGAIIGNTWLRLCRKIGRIKSELTNKLWIAGGNPNYGTAMLYRRTKWQKLWAWIIFQTIPAYPLHNRGWQLYVMPDSKRKERLKRILLSRIGISNIMLRLLFEPKVIYNTEYLKSPYKLVTQEEVDGYPHMTGYRPGVYLDETCRRTIRELTAQESEYNTYEKDLIKYLYDDM